MVNARTNIYAQLFDILVLEAFKHQHVHLLSFTASQMRAIYHEICVVNIYVIDAGVKCFAQFEYHQLSKMHDNGVLLNR